MFIFWLLVMILLVQSIFIFSSNKERGKLSNLKNSFLFVLFQHPRLNISKYIVKVVWVICFVFVYCNFYSYVISRIFIYYSWILFVSSNFASGFEIPDFLVVFIFLPSAHSFILLFSIETPHLTEFYKILALCSFNLSHIGEKQ